MALGIDVPATVSRNQAIVSPPAEIVSPPAEIVSEPPDPDLTGPEPVKHHEPELAPVPARGQQVAEPTERLKVQKATVIAPADHQELLDEHPGDLRKLLATLLDEYAERHGYSTTVTELRACRDLLGMGV